MAFRMSNAVVDRPTLAHYGSLTTGTERKPPAGRRCLCCSHWNCGVDCANVDSTQDPERPAHTRFLGQGILIVENLTGLSRLHGVAFRFFSIPLKARDAAAFPVRAFAEVRD